MIKVLSPCIAAPLQAHKQGDQGSGLNGHIKKPEVLASPGHNRSISQKRVYTGIPAYGTDLASRELSNDSLKNARNHRRLNNTSRKKPISAGFKAAAYF
jgi:hypothetical protein